MLFKKKLNILVAKVQASNPMNFQFIYIHLFYLFPVFFPCGKVPSLRYSGTNLVRRKDCTSFCLLKCALAFLSSIISCPHGQKNFLNTIQTVPCLQIYVLHALEEEKYLLFISPLQDCLEDLNRKR